MHDARHRRLCSGADVGRRPRDGAGRRQPAEQRRRHVGDPLRHQLHVRIVPVAAHPVGDNRRHQRLERAEHRHRQRRTEQDADEIGPEPRDGQCGPPRRNAAEAGADRLDRQLKEGDHRRPGKQGHDVARHFRHESAPDDQCDQARCPQRRCGARIGVEVARDGDHARPEVARHVGAKPEKVFDLRARNQHADAVGKSNHDRSRNELHRGAHSGRAQHDEQDARHHGAHEQPVEAVGRHDARDDDHEGTGRAADLESRSAERGDEKAGDDGAVDSRLRLDARRDGECHRQRQRDEPDGDARDDVGNEGAARVAFEEDHRLRQPGVGHESPNRIRAMPLENVRP